MNHQLPQNAFEVEVQESLDRVRTSLTVLLDVLNLSSVPALEVAHVLKLDKSLAWKISKLAEAHDPAALGELIPGSAGWDIFFHAARRAGAGGDLLTSVKESVEGLNDLVEKHAGDRTTFGMLVGCLGSEGASKIEATHRRQLFQGASYVWGLQAGAILNIQFIGPSKTPGMLDAVNLRGLINVKRLRREAVCVLGPFHVSSDTGEVYDAPRLLPLDPAFSAPDTVPFLGEFSSSPLPDSRRVRLSSGTGYDLLEIGPVGKPGISTFITGEYLPECVPRFAQPGDEMDQHMTWIRVPAESLLLDVYIERSLDRSIDPKFTLYNKLKQLGASEEPDFIVQLPTSEGLESLGSAPVARPGGGIRNYGKMINYICDKVGWQADQFDVSRVHLNYPPVASVAVVHYTLPTA